MLKRTIANIQCMLWLFIYYKNIIYLFVVRLVYFSFETLVCFSHLHHKYLSILLINFYLIRLLEHILSHSLTDSTLYPSAF